MYKVTGKENDMFKVLDLDDGTEELLSASELVLGLGQAEIEGCQHSEHGIEVWYDGVDKYEIPIEVWAPVSVFNVKRFDGSYKYMVSNLGHVKIPEYYDSVGEFHEERVLHGNVHNGYIRFNLQVDIVRRQLQLNVLVGTEFIYNPNGLPQVNHKNENKLDNKACNLEWCTAKYNTNYGTANKRRSKALGAHIRQYDVNGRFVDEFTSIRSALRKIGACPDSRSSILSSCARINKVAYGFVWRCVADDELFGKTELERKSIIRELISGEYTVFEDEVGNSIVAKCRYSVRQYTVSGVYIKEFLSSKVAAEEAKVREWSISKACRREIQTCSGFIWRYAHDDEFADRPENAKAIEEWRKTHSV